MLPNSWTAQLYLRAENGSFISVPIMGIGDDADASMVVSFIQRPSPGVKAEDLLGFSTGFRILGGNQYIRKIIGKIDAKVVTFTCLGSDRQQTHDISSYNCPDGLRAELTFPSCSNAKDLDPAHHQ